MNKTLLAVILLLATYLPVHARNNDPVYAKTEKTEINPVTGKTFSVTQYDLPKDIARFRINKEGNAVLALSKKRNGHFSESGEIVSLNLETGKLDWSLPVKTSRVLWTPNILYYQSNVGAYTFDITNGKRLYTAKESSLFVDSLHEIGYNGRSAIDLKTGKKVWSHAITPDKVPVDEMVYLNDSTVVISHAGPHLFNLNTGKGWDYDMRTYKKDYTGVFVATAVSVAMVGLAGAVVLGDEPDIRMGYSSNIAHDEENVYFADRSSMICVNSGSGKLIWEKDLKPIGTSEIAVNDRYVVLIHKGQASNKDVGTPFIAAFEKNTGKQIFQENIPGGVSSFHIKNDTCWVYNGNLYKIDLHTGKYAMHPFSANRPVSPGRWFVDAEKIFVEGGKGLLQPISKIFPQCFFMQTDNGEIGVFNNKGELQQLLKPDGYWLSDRQYNDFNTFMNGKQEIAFARGGQKLFALQRTFRTEIIGDKIYRIIDKGLQVISLPEVLAN